MNDCSFIYSSSLDLNASNGIEENNKNQHHPKQYQQYIRMHERTQNPRVVKLILNFIISILKLYSFLPQMLL